MQHIPEKGTFIQPNVVDIFLNIPLKYVVGNHWKRLSEALLMSTHNVCFRGESRKNITLLPPLI